MKKTDINKFVEILKKTYPDATCSLDFETPFQMVVSVMLSAHCTDERVNKTTPTLFQRCKTIQNFADIDLKELEQIIHPCGFYKNKAKNIKATSNILVNEYNSTVPNAMEELLTLPGVGRKTANVVMLEAFNSPQGVAVDTHCKRISNRIGFSNEATPEKIEQDLLKLFPKKYYYDLNHILIWHGRNICTSQSPKCEICPISYMCKYRKTKKC